MAALPSVADVSLRLQPLASQQDGERVVAGLDDSLHGVRATFVALNDGGAEAELVLRLAADSGSSSSAMPVRAAVDALRASTAANALPGGATPAGASAADAVQAVFMPPGSSGGDDGSGSHSGSSGGSDVPVAYVSEQVIEVAGAPGSESQIKTVKLHNRGNAVLHLTAAPSIVAAEEASGQWLAVEEPTVSAAPGQAVTLYFRFNPAGLRSGFYSAAVAVAHNAPPGYTIFLANLYLTGSSLHGGGDGSGTACPSPAPAYNGTGVIGSALNVVHSAGFSAGFFAGVVSLLLAAALLTWLACCVKKRRCIGCSRAGPAVRFERLDADDDDSSASSSHAEGMELSEVVTSGGAGAVSSSAGGISAGGSLGVSSGSGSSSGGGGGLSFSTPSLAVRSGPFGSGGGAVAGSSSGGGGGSSGSGGVMGTGSLGVGSSGSSSSVGGSAGSGSGMAKASSRLAVLRLDPHATMPAELFEPTWKELEVTRMWGATLQKLPEDEELQDALAAVDVHCLASGKVDGLHKLYFFAIEHDKPAAEALMLEITITLASRRLSSVFKTTTATKIASFMALVKSALEGMVEMEV
eukprot:PLAT3317.31.p1 GENE.PLAT3317.31~~PLAT3317.31.p1  ORF type:complete len:580 (-),score=321.12 PLAT3317.31:23-1762(-)